MAFVQGRSNLPKTRIPTDRDVLLARVAAVVAFVGIGVGFVTLAVFVVVMARAGVL